MATDELNDDERARLNEVTRLTQEANEHYDAGRFAAAAPLYHQALIIEEEVLSPAHPSVASSRCNLGNLYYVQEKYNDAETMYLRALTLLERQHGLQSPEMIDTLIWLAETRFHNQQYDEAKEPYERAILILEKQHDEARLADALMRLAHLHYFIGEYAESEPYYLRALSLSEQVLGSEHLSVADSAGQLARLYHLHPEFGKDAEPLFRRALIIREKIQGPDHPGVAESLYRLADHYRLQNRVMEAEPLYRRALMILDAHPELGEMETHWMRSGVADYLRETGREAEAKELEASWGDWNAYEDMLRAEVEKREATLGSEHPGRVLLPSEGDGLFQP